MKKKKIQPPYQQAIPYKAENVPLSTSGRIDLAIPENQEVFDFLKSFANTWNRLLHWTFRQIMDRNFETEGELKKAIMENGEVKARVANSILKEARQTYHSAIEIKKTQIEEHNRKIDELVQEIARLELEKAKKHASVPNWSKPPKGAVKEYRAIKSKLWSKKNKLDRYRAAVRRLEKEVRTGRFSYCFGSKKLARQQWTLEHPNSPFSTHGQWQKKWRTHRYRHVYFLGSSDETCGCQLVQGTYTGADGWFEFRLRSPYADDRKVYSFRVRIPWQTALLDWHQKHRSVSYVFIFKENGSLYIHPQLEEEADETFQAKGCLGMDINDGFLSVTQTDEYGNYVASEDLFYDDYSPDADTAMQQILAAVYRKAAEECLSVAIEDVAFDKKKAQNLGKEMNHTLHRFPYSKYRSYNERKASRSGVPLHIVSAYYTSQIGRKKYKKQLQISVHQAAAYVIARRALGFKEIYQAPKKEQETLLVSEESISFTDELPIITF